MATIATIYSLPWFGNVKIYHEDLLGQFFEIFLRFARRNIPDYEITEFHVQMQESM